MVINISIWGHVQNTSRSMYVQRPSSTSDNSMRDLPAFSSCAHISSSWHCLVISRHFVCWGASQHTQHQSLLFGQIASHSLASCYASKLCTCVVAPNTSISPHHLVGRELLGHTLGEDHRLYVGLDLLRDTSTQGRWFEPRDRTSNPPVARQPFNLLSHRVPVNQSVAGVSTESKQREEVCSCTLSRRMLPNKTCNANCSHGIHNDGLLQIAVHFND